MGPRIGQFNKSIYPLTTSSGGGGTSKVISSRSGVNGVTSFRRFGTVLRPGGKRPQGANFGDYSRLLNGQNAYAFLNNNPFASRTIEIPNNTQVNSLKGTLEAIDNDEKDSSKQSISKLRKKEVKLRQKIISAKVKGNTAEVEKLQEQLDKVKEKIYKAIDNNIDV